MNLIEKPMLAGKCERPENLSFPVLASPKLDGIRCLVVDFSVAVSRNFKPIPNRFIRTHLQKIKAHTGLDGELMIRGSNNFQEVSSAVMSGDGFPDFEFRVFDYVARDLKTDYACRTNDLAAACRALGDHRIVPVMPVAINTLDELLAYEQKCLAEGYEGVMVRDPRGPYKCGRSTEREGFLLKLKRFQDDEATVTGFKERLHNANEATTDELGRTKRSSHQENMVPTGTLGALCCKTSAGVEFDIGTGFDDALRKRLWEGRAWLAGQKVKFKSQPTGVKDKPRFPVFLGFRHENDL